MRLCWADSEVSAVDRVGGALCIRLSAASVDLDGVDGFARGVLLRLEDARIGVEQPPAIGRIREGLLRTGAQAVRAVLLPCRIDAPVVLELEFANGSLLVVEAAAFGVDAPGAGEVRESLAC